MFYFIYPGKQVNEIHWKIRQAELATYLIHLAYRALFPAIEIAADRPAHEPVF